MVFIQKNGSNSNLIFLNKSKIIIVCLLLLFINVGSLFSQVVQISEKKYSPQFDASLKTKYEYALGTGMSRFSVRNSRLGLSGNVTEPISYRVQVELSNEGQFTVLDLSATINLFKDFNLTLGQTSIPIYNSYVVSPQSIMFANRTFIGKFFTGTRDIGASANYTIHTSIAPVMLEFGVFNGFTINDPVWTNKLSYAARVQVGTMQGFRATAKIYDYPLSEQKDFFVWGADLRYGGPRYKIEAEVMNRHNKFNSTDRLSYYVQGGYSFPLKNVKLFHDITPVVRWDAIGDQVNELNFDASRITVGLDFGLSKKPFGSVIRFDYEQYFTNRNIPEFNSYGEMDSNKFTVELLLIF